MAKSNKEKRSTIRYSSVELQLPKRISYLELHLPTNPKPVFGFSLEEHLQNYAPRQVSIVLETCICALYDKGIQTEGILRIPGTHDDVYSLKRLFDKGIKFDILKFDIHTIASSLKMYLRELPNPLIPTNFYERFLTGMVNQRAAAKIVNIKKLLSEFPVEYLVNLRYLLAFLHEVSLCEYKNKMNGKALGICIGTNLLRMPKKPNSGFGESFIEIAHFGPRNTSVQFLIENAREIFPNFDIEQKSLTCSPGSLYLSSRSVSVHPKRFSELRDFFRKRIDHFIFGRELRLKENVHPARNTTGEESDSSFRINETHAASLPSTSASSSLSSNTFSRNLSQSNYDIRKTEKRHSSASIKEMRTNSKLSRLSLDSQVTNRSLGRLSTLSVNNDTVFEATNEEESSLQGATAQAT